MSGEFTSSMKTRKQALAYGLSFPDTYQDAPFHDENWQLVRYKGNDKAFLWTYERDGFKENFEQGFSNVVKEVKRSDRYEYCS